MTQSRVSSRTKALTYSSLAVALLGGCSAASSDAAGGRGLGGKADEISPDSIACQNPASYPDNVLSTYLGVNESRFLHNYTAWPTYGQGRVEVPADVVRRVVDKDEARELLASRFPGCEGRMKQHFDRAPNVYIYFEGYGGGEQDNTNTFSPAILRWVNERDPDALIFAINWNCAAEPGSFCETNAEAIRMKDSDPPYLRMKAALEAAGGGLPEDPAVLLENAVAQGSGEGSAGEAYDTAMSHSIHLAARLVDQLLVAELGKVHFIGYSMGAQSAAQVLIQDFTGNGDGYEWTRDDACDGGGNKCTVADLSQVDWSLSLGLPGWSEALRSYNGFDARGQAERDDAFRTQHENGGLLRIADERFNNKLNVFNRRMDPTSNSDDLLYRYLGDANFAEYNHQGHDYALPLFIDRDFIATLETFLATPSPRDVPELGSYFDNAGRVTFDDCTGGACRASTGYYAHSSSRSHQVVDIPRTSEIDSVSPGVGDEGSAASFRGDGAPFAIRTFDQEDLRGGVELYYRPGFEPSDGDLHGIFSYGGCGTSNDDLMPEAFIEGGQIVFSMRYQGETYEARIDASDAGLSKDDWSHLAFTWNLPTVSMSHDEDPSRYVGTIGASIGIAGGLMRAPHTTYRRQQGEGDMRIYVDGQERAVAALGKDGSTRDCMVSQHVLSPEQGYDVNGAQYQRYSPYANYGVGSDAVYLNNQPSGLLCKGFRIRNTEAFFGCARSDGAANADADIDEVVLVWGPGRTDYANVSEDGPVDWPIR